MKRTLSWLQNRFLRQISTILILGFVFFSFPAFSYSNSMLVAKADTVKTPEGIYYKGTPDEGKFGNEGQLENAQRKLKEAGDNVRKKLNLDEKTPEATKEFLDSVKNKVEKTVEPITGNRRGYYQ